MVPAIVTVVIVAALFLIYSNSSSIGGVLSAMTIHGLAQQAGFSGDDLVIAVAVALAESGGNASAYNPETAAVGGTPVNQGSFGLWQIYLKDHLEFSGDNLYDPQTNANDAYELYIKAGNSFSPWSTFKNGAYWAHMDVARAAIQA